MKNLVKKACLLVSALMVGGVSNASTIYSGDLIFRDDIEYNEEENFEPGFGQSKYKSENSSSDLGGIIAWLVLTSLIYVGIQSGKNYFFSGNNRNSRDEDTQKTIRRQIFIREIRKQSEVNVVKKDTPKY